MNQIVAKLAHSLADKRFRFLTLMATLTLLWACYPVSHVTYSDPQDSSINQWLIEVKTGDAKVQLTMRYSRKRDSGGFSYNNTGFGIPLEQLTGLTREQAMSSGDIQLRRLVQGWQRLWAFYFQPQRELCLRAKPTGIRQTN